MTRHGEGADYAESNGHDSDYCQSRIGGDSRPLRGGFCSLRGRLNTKPVRVNDLDELEALLMELKMGEDEARRWVGKARTQGVVLIAGVERTELQLKENGLLA